MRTLIARLAPFLLALGLCAASVACGGPASDATVTILVPWNTQGDPGEYEAFNAVIEKFEQQTGITVISQSTRDESGQLDADLAAGDPPDVVDLSSPGLVKLYQGRLKPLRIGLGNYAQPWKSLAMLGTGTVYAVPVKADVQSLIWYSTAAVKSPPATMAALQSLSGHGGTPWCLGLASGPTSGWPGASWIADILMSTYHTGAYKYWLNGTLAWDSPPVANSWREWGTLLHHGTAVDGGVLGALTKPFNKALGDGKCELEYGALTATGLTSTAGYDYVPAPSGSGDASPVLVSGDFMGMLTDNANARQLLGYLATDKAQALWVSSRSGHAFSADKAVPSGSYPLAVQRGIARLLVGNGTTRCFNAEDLMPPDLTVAFSQAVLEYVSNSSSLDGLLSGLQQTERGTSSSKVWEYACSD